MASVGDVISSLTLIVGNEPELVYKTLEEVVQKLEHRFGFAVEKISFQGGECSVQDIVSAISQNYMFSPAALITLRDPSELSAEEAEALLSALNSYTGDNCLVLANFSGTVDSKLKAFFSGKGSLIDCSLNSKGGKSSFLGDEVHQSGLHFSPDAFRRLAETLGEDVAQAIPTLELLKASLGEGATVDTQTLEMYLPMPGDVAPWDFTDAVEAGKVGQALDMLWRLMRAGKKHPLVVLAILQRRFIELAVVSGTNIHDTEQALARLRARDNKFNKPPFVIRKMIASARALGPARLAQAFVWMSQADRQIKGEGGLSPELAIELLVARLAKSFSNRAP